MSVGGLPGAARARRAQLFVDREEEVALFLDALLVEYTEWNILEIFGIGGIGKSFLLSQLLDVCREVDIPAILANALGLANRSISGFQKSVRDQLTEYDPSFSKYDQAIADYRELRAKYSASVVDNRIGEGAITTREPLRDLRVAMDNEFVNALNSIATKSGRLVLAVDAFEDIYGSPVDVWLRTEFVPRASHLVLLIISGRARLGPEWEQWRVITRSIELQPFSVEATRELLRMSSGLEVDDQVVSSIVKSTGGHPLAISVLIHGLTSRQVGLDELTVPDEFTVPSGELIALVTERLVSSLDRTSKTVLEALSVLSVADEEALSYLLKTQGLDTSETLGSLRRLSLVRHSGRGLYELHPTVRDFIAADLRTRTPSRYQNFHRASLAYYQDRLASVVSRDQWTFAALKALQHQLVVNEGKGVHFFRELFGMGLVKGHCSGCRQLLYALRDYHFTDKGRRNEVKSLNQELTTKLNYVEDLLLCWERRDSVNLIGALVRLLDLPPTGPDEIRKTENVTAFALDTSTIQDAGLPPFLPVVVLEQVSPTPLLFEQVRDLLEGLLSPPARVALFIAYIGVGNGFNSLIEKLQHTYAYDVILMGRDGLLKIVASQNPQQAIRSAVLSTIDLVSASSFIASGPALGDMFFGREHELREIRERIAMINYALIGGRRIGKTSILKRLESVHLRTAQFRPLYHDCSFTPAEAELVQAMIADKLWFPKTPASLPTSFAQIVRNLPHDRLLIILLDEVDKLIKPDRAAGYPFFKTLRALANTGRCRFVLSGERSLRAELGNPNSPLYNFANEMLIGHLEFSAVEELVSRPMQQLEIELIDAEKMIRHIWGFTSGHPNVVQRLCQRLIVRLNRRGDRRLTLDDVEAVVANPHFLRRDFLSVYWERATALERLCSLVMAANDNACDLTAMHRALTGLDLEVTLNQVDNALERLVDLRNILRRTVEGYEFAVSAFPEVIAKTARLDDLIALNCETYRLHGDVEPQSKRGAL